MAVIRMMFIQAKKMNAIYDIAVYDIYEIWDK